MKLRAIRSRWKGWRMKSHPANNKIRRCRKNWRWLMRRLRITKSNCQNSTEKLKGCRFWVCKQTESTIKGSNRVAVISKTSNPKSRNSKKVKYRKLKRLMNWKEEMLNWRPTPNKFSWTSNKTTWSLKRRNLSAIWKYRSWVLLLSSRRSISKH